MRIVLGSSSPRRSEILHGNKINFTIKKPNYDENLEINGNPYIETMNAALNKAMSLFSGLEKSDIIICADTIVYKDKIIGKPTDENDAYNTLNFLSNSKHSVITAFAILSENMRIVDYDETHIWFNSLTHEQINSYIKTKEPLDKAGSYAIQGIGKELVNRIDGDFDNVVGFPYDKISDYLVRFFGYNGI